MNFSVTAVVLGVSLVCIDNAGAAFHGDPPDKTHPWAIHDENRPQPKVVKPGICSTQNKPGTPPSDAVVLFDGKDLSKWVSTKDGSPAKWKVQDGWVEVTPGQGDIQTKEEFGECQLHVEWTAPTEIKGNSQGRGNSGIFLLGQCEVQVLDCYDNVTYADGAASAIYGINPPMANALRPPGEFQAYDIVFRRPVYRNGKMVDPGHVTIFVNGVLTQDATPLEGPGGHLKRSHHQPFPATGPLKLQDHRNPVRFRNIWYRPLPPRPVDGGYDGGFLTEEATMAKRKETAATIREEAAKMAASTQRLDRMTKLMESLAYEKDSQVTTEVETLAANYADSLKQLSPEQIKARKDEIRWINDAVQYTTKHGFLPENLPLKADLEKIVWENKWDK